MDKNNIRLRAVILGLILALGICVLTPFNNAYRSATPLGGGHFPMAPFFLLVCLTIIMAGINKIFNKNLFTGKELLMIWLMMVLVSGIAYTGLVRTFFINLTAPFYYAGIENNWEKTIQPLLPGALYPQNREAVESLYNGIPGGSRMSWVELMYHIPWKVWISPLLIWGGFILLCYFVMICMISVLSRQWIHNERINLPLLIVPKLMEEAFDENRLIKFLTNPFMLAGLSIPIFLHTINGLNFYYPVVPRISTLVLAGHYFPAHGIFSGFHKLKIYIYPAFIGFAFLTSRSLSFSFWVFFFLGGLLFGLLTITGFNIPAASLGVSFGPTLVRPEEMQMIGAYGIFFIFIMWLSRHHLLEVLKESIGTETRHKAKNEWMQPYIAFRGGAAGFIAIIIWCHYFGMSLLPAILMVGAYFMIMLVASRIICQGGIAYFTLTAAPIDGILTFFGPGFFSHAGILLAGVIQKVLFVDLRESLMPSLVHSRNLNQKMAGKKTVFSGILIVLGAGVFTSFVSMLSLCYKYGIRELQLDWANRTTINVYKNINTLIASPVRSSEWVLIFTLAGAAVMLVLVICYSRFYWWPLHPIGYLTAYSSAMRILWFSFFTGWLFNSLCIRYGGISLYKKLQYLFMGLIIGDFLMGGIWAVIGFFGDASYLVLPD